MCFLRNFLAISSCAVPLLLVGCIVIPPMPAPGGGGPGEDPDPDEEPDEEPAVLEYAVESIEVYTLPAKKSGQVYWDAPGPWVSELDRRFPDVYFVGTRGTTSLFRTPTITDHDPTTYTSIQVPPIWQRMDSSRIIHLAFYDQDQSNDDEMGGYSITVPTPASGAVEGSRQVQYTNDNGQVHFMVNFRYREAVY